VCQPLEHHASVVVAADLARGDGPERVDAVDGRVCGARSFDELGDLGDAAALEADRDQDHAVEQLGVGLSRALAQIELLERVRLGRIDVAGEQRASRPRERVRPDRHRLAERPRELTAHRENTVGVGDAPGFDQGRVLVPIGEVREVWIAELLDEARELLAAVQPFTERARVPE
jgi:hypothetical protein